MVTGQFSCSAPSSSRGFFSYKKWEKSAKNNLLFGVESWQHINHLCPSCGQWRKFRQHFVLWAWQKFSMIRKQPFGRRSACNVWKLHKMLYNVLKTQTGCYNKNQNKIFHSHRDKRHKFPLRIDSFAPRQTLQNTKKK